MLGDEFSMLDVAVAPLLWRLDHYGIELSKTAAPLMKRRAHLLASGVYRSADPVGKGRRCAAPLFLKSIGAFAGSVWRRAGFYRSLETHV
jgi:hypothetical protein